jgi:hypothetical protein
MQESERDKVENQLERELLEKNGFMAFLNLTYRVLGQVKRWKFELERSLPNLSNVRHSFLIFFQETIEVQKQLNSFLTLKITSKAKRVPLPKSATTLICSVHVCDLCDTL